MDISVIIVSWNTKNILRDCLLSVYEQTQNIDYEVIVVDNASTDGSTEMVKKEFPQAVVLENSENRGFAAANNQAIEIAKGRYILLLNSDTIILNNAIGKTLSFAEEHPKAAAVGCRIKNKDHSTQPSCFMYPSILNMLLSSSYLYKLLPKNRFFSREAMTWWDGKDSRQVDVVKGCFMLLNTKAIAQTGTLDEQYFMFCEETDLCYRFKKTGWEIWYTPDADIIHLGGASRETVANEMLLQLRGSKLRFIKKHKGRLAHFIARVLTMTFFLIRIPYWFIKTIFSKKARRQNRYRTGLYAKGAFYAIVADENLLINKKGDARI